MKNSPIRIAIVGADEVAQSLLEIIHNHPSVHAVGIVDADPDAPAMAHARAIGLQTETDLRVLLKQKSDLVIDLANRLSPAQKQGRTVIGGAATHLIRTLIGEKLRSQSKSEKLLTAYRSIYNLSLELSSPNYIPRLYSAVIRYATDLTETPAGSLAMFDEQQGEMVLVASRGFSKGFAHTYRWKVRKGGLTAHILNQKGALIIEDLTKYPQFDNPIFLAEKIRALAAIPLAAEGKIVGILYVNDFKRRSFSTLETSVLQLIATIAATLIERAKIMEVTQLIAITDELTGLFNHRHFLQRLSVEIARAGRYHHEVALAMLDVDHFKHYNDTHGHLQGNEILKWLGKVIRSSLREADIPARYGGEEFAIIMPETTAADAKVIAERLRRAVEETPFQNDALGEKRITVSIGVAVFPDAPTTHALIDASDKALYMAKATGRNRICLASDRHHQKKNQYLC